MESQSKHTPLVVIVGETASGKSALAMSLAKQFNGEIIAADSWTVYKDFNIGTAKPSGEDQKQVRHHLIDVADPKSGFSAAEYKRLAFAAIEDITQRGKLPILVGGTGLYVDSVIFNYGFLPPAAPGIRDQLNHIAIDGLLEEIEKRHIDINGIDIRNKRRLIRVLETNGGRPSRDAIREETLVIGISIPRDNLRERITTRVDAMLITGLEDEVASLAQKYGWNVEPMKGIGYREFREYFNGPQTLEQTRDRILSASLNLAKRQRTWFKRNGIIHWVDEQGEAVEITTTFLNKYPL